MIYIAKNLYCSKPVRFKKQIRTVRDRKPLPLLLPENNINLALVRTKIRFLFSRHGHGHGHDHDHNGHVQVKVYARLAVRTHSH